MLILIATSCSTMTAHSSVGSLDAANEARKSEIAFARAFAERDKAAFGQWIAEDAVFVSGGKETTGRVNILKRWDGFLSSTEPPFSWEPASVSSNAKGDLALSTGPIHNKTGKVVGTYISTWQRQEDGKWKVVFDGPGCSSSE